MGNTAQGSGVAAITLSKRTNILTLNIAITSMAREDTLSGKKWYKGNQPRNIEDEVERKDFGFAHQNNSWKHYNDKA
jgi:hypothetical protein